MNFQEVITLDKKELEQNKNRYYAISTGKLSPQNSVRIPLKICQNANWLEGDELMFYLDTNSNNIVIVNETLNELPSTQAIFFNQNLSQKINDDMQVIIIQADAFNQSHPLILMRDYIKGYSGYINHENIDQGKWYLTEGEEERLHHELESSKKENNIRQYEIHKKFLTEYKRNISTHSLPGGYIFNYHYAKKNKNIMEELKNILKTGSKIVLWGYHNVNNELSYLLNTLEIVEYYYLKYTAGEDIVEAKKTANSKSVLIDKYF